MGITKRAASRSKGMVQAIYPKASYDMIKGQILVEDYNIPLTAQRQPESQAWINAAVFIAAGHDLMAA